MMKQSADYRAIKADLREWLAKQDYWKDFDLDATGIDMIVSLLAQSEYRNSLTAAMLFNEQFLTTAQFPDNIIKTAKALGYTPKSRTPASMVVNIKVEEGGHVLPNTLYIPKGTIFSGKVAGAEEYPPLQFVLPETISAEKSGSSWYFSGVTLLQGSYGLASFVIDNARRYNVYDLPDANVVTNQIEAFVHRGVNEDVYDVYHHADKVMSVGPDDRVFFVEALKDGRYGIYFGENGIGKTPEDNHILRVSYLVTDGEAANGYDHITFVATPNDPALDDAVWTFYTVEKAKGGSEREDPSDVAFNARHLWTAQNRAVTEHDFKSIILKTFSEFRDVAVWGGDKNDPPVWGKTFVCPFPKDGGTVAQSSRESLENWFKAKYAHLTTQVEVVQPDYVYLLPSIVATVTDTGAFFDRNKIAAKIVDTFTEYVDSKVSGFNNGFYHSDAVSVIGDVDEAILGNHLQIQLAKRQVLFPDVPFTTASSFGNAIVPGTFNSSMFIYRNKHCLFTDDGEGTIQILTKDGETIDDKAGIVNYATGAINIAAVEIERTADGKVFIQFTATPQKTDIKAKNANLIRMEKTDVKVSIHGQD